MTRRSRIPLPENAASELIRTLGEMRPAFEVQRDHNPSSEDPRDIRSVVGGQRQVSAIELRQLDRAGVEDGNPDISGLLDDRAHDVAGSVVAGDVDLLGSRGGQNESEYRALNIVAAVRAMLRVHSGHRDDATARILDLDG